MQINGVNRDIKLEARNYNGDTFAIEIQTKINAILPNTFTVTFVPTLELDTTLTMVQT